tara:strand:+ start:1132 stop:1344 length:213 start_codon:yes stop_codon:yes gene_type:complete
MKKSLYHKKVVLLETLVTLVHDNFVNFILIIIATQLFNVKLETSLFIWLIGQSLNFIFSFVRRFYFQRFY